MADSALRRITCWWTRIMLTVGLGLVAVGAFHLRASNLGTTFAMVTMIVGIWIAVISFTGYFGTVMEHFGFLRGFITLLSMVLILETGFIIWFVSIEPDKVRSIGSQIWGYLYDHDRLALQNIETGFECCGYLHTWDRSSSSLSCQYIQPCYIMINQIFDNHKSILIAGAVIVIGLQILSILLTTLMVEFMERSEHDEVYRPLLQQHVSPVDYGGSHSNNFSGYQRARRPSKGIRSSSSSLA
ncbi:Tetraspanin family-domain-containing protein [Umbelopsis sp. PMI_123]|nr:Tetraspanin family-domain-containing protein [Umbelopsis sp. PMI_123]